MERRDEGKLPQRNTNCQKTHTRNFFTSLTTRKNANQNNEVSLHTREIGINQKEQLALATILPKRILIREKAYWCSLLGRQNGNPQKLGIELLCDPLLRMYPRNPKAQQRHLRSCIKLQHSSQ